MRVLKIFRKLWHKMRFLKIFRKLWDKMRVLKMFRKMRHKMRVLKMFINLWHIKNITNVITKCVSNGRRPWFQTYYQCLEMVKIWLKHVGKVKGKAIPLQS